MTTINFRSKFLVCRERASPQRRDVTDAPVNHGTRGPATSDHCDGAMAARAVRHPARGRLAPNGAEDPPPVSAARFRERGQLLHRADAKIPKLRLPSPPNARAPKSPEPALPKAFP